MTENRPITFNLLYDVFKTKFPFSSIGLTFIILSLFVFIPLIVFFNSTNDAYEKYDYDKIKTLGKELVATVSSVQIQNNVTVNDNLHPHIINYTFNDNGQKKNDKFKTLENADKLIFKKETLSLLKFTMVKQLLKTLNLFHFQFTFSILCR